MKLFKKNVAGALRPEGRLVVEKIPRDQSDATEVRVADDSEAPRSSSASIVGDETHFTLAGRPPRNEEGGLLAVGYVVEVLNAAGGRWSTPQKTLADARTEKGFDAVATGPRGTELLLQVTRVEEQRIWKILGALRVASTARTHEAHADMLWAAAARKRARADPRIVLVLDATATPQLAVKGVVRSFHRRYGARAHELGFREVWLAGYTATVTVRLDVVAL